MSTPFRTPNILLISLDDAVAFWNYRRVFGEVLQTPNLDRICGISTAYHRAYCQAPVCSPSRASFMSGLSPVDSGITGPDPRFYERMPATALWPAALKAAGWHCSSGGKMVRGAQPLPELVHNVLYSDGPKTFRMGRRPRIYATPERSERTEIMAFGGMRGGEATVHSKDDDTFYDHHVCQSAIDFLDSYDRAAPFYREVGFCAPHGPWRTPRRFKELYNVRRFTQPSAWQAGFGRTRAMNRAAPPNFRTSRQRFWRKSVRNYFSALSYVDDHVGQVWDALKRSRHRDNTVVILLSDHGMHLGEHGRFRKHTLLEQVAQVPLIVHLPWQAEGVTISQPVGLTDVGPTVMDIAGLPPIPRTRGRSLLSPEPARDTEAGRAIPTFLHDHASLRKGRYRLIRFGDGTTRLYDLENDWWQTRDLGTGHSAFPEMEKALTACCAPVAHRPLRTAI